MHLHQELGPPHRHRRYGAGRRGDQGGRHDRDELHRRQLRSEPFPDPLRFDIDRNPNDSLAFSYGPHRCIGIFLAKLEGRAAFEELLARFPSTESRGPVSYRSSLATTVIESMPVVFR